eukprot:234580-Rhodomonas_salina.1
MSQRRALPLSSLLRHHRSHFCSQVKVRQRCTSPQYPRQHPRPGMANLCAAQVKVGQRLALTERPQQQPLDPISLLQLHRHQGTFGQAPKIFRNATLAQKCPGLVCENDAAAIHKQI